MSDIKRFLLRLPDGLYDSLELQAMKLNTSVNSLIIDRLSDNVGQVPKRMAGIEMTRKIAAALPNTYSGSDIQQPAPKVEREAKSVMCAECGSMIGHQKWCKSK